MLDVLSNHDVKFRIVHVRLRPGVDCISEGTDVVDCDFLSFVQFKEVIHFEGCNGT